MKRARLLAIPLLALIPAGCGSSSSSSSAAPASTSASTSAAAPSSGGATLQVTMKNLSFLPATINARVGQSVQWTNLDTPPHNVMPVSGPKFAPSPTLSTGGKFTLKLTQPGTIHYFCSIHPFMKATIVVSK
ncbi:MAG: cupredoxin domain-containing protein [Actinomycetota bacterium]|nr:cupredoxin domain-containing protein [Actinomycetota bacterium]